MDAPIRDLVDLLNGHPDLYTTSSCSGRTSVFAEPDEVGDGAHTHACSHATTRPSPSHTHTHSLPRPSALHLQASRASGKKGGEWVYASHERPMADQVVEALKERCGSGVGGGGGGREVLGC